MNTHLFLEKNEKTLAKCRKCNKLKEIEHYFSLYSIAILDEKVDVEGRKPLFILYSPYPILKDRLPDLEKLGDVKKYNGHELATIGKGKRAHDSMLSAFNKETALRYYLKNFDQLNQYLSERD
ncbi:hypothetical protein AF332_16810 [Sporosarcina globispora]|uniref:Uncharacterized protein n=1 Tax=Sporosarcina globispora TaxID=1459 RepID=A0A0M0GFT3_SPOGL|nr:hypothetical protein [Sporosarcina globispora]KON88296.1 hypothetical protein AF332_16810 [Sporosarcina globispora]